MDITKTLFLHKQVRKLLEVNEWPTFFFFPAPFPRVPFVGAFPRAVLFRGPLRAAGASTKYISDKLGTYASLTLWGLSFSFILPSIIGRLGSTICFSVILALRQVA
jgi:hypothetical protein